MSKLIKKTPFLFWGMIPLISIYGFLFSNEAVDINIHDTYFVFMLYLLLIPLCLYLYLIGLAYYFSYKSEKFNPLNFLTIVHLILTVTCLLILFFIPKFPEPNPNDLMENIRNSLINRGLRKWAVLGFAFAQLVLLLNLSISIFRK